MNRKALSIKTHTSLFVGEGLGDLGDYLPNPRKSFVLNMTATEIGVIVEATPSGPTARASGPTVILVPYGNIKQVVLAPEEPKPSGSAKLNAA